MVERLNKINFLPPEKWLPLSPDCAACDNFLGEYLEKQLNRTKVRTFLGLQKAIKEEVGKLPPKNGRKSSFGLPNLRNVL